MRKKEKRAKPAQTESKSIKKMKRRGRPFSFFLQTAPPYAAMDIQMLYLPASFTFRIQMSLSVLVPLLLPVKSPLVDLAVPIRPIH